MADRFKILLAEDELNFGTVLENYLRLAKYDVDWCKNGKEAYSKLKTYTYDLCIFDVMMPEMDGFSLASEFKKINTKTPFIFLTAKGLKEDILEGFKLGADDYLKKPFDSEILLEKIKAILRRKSSNSSNAQESAEYEIGKYTFKVRNRQLTYESDSIRLSPKEAALLAELCAHKNQLMPRSEALQKIWGDDNYFTGRSMDVYLAKLRKYLKNDTKISIVNIHGDGFQLNIDD